MILNQSFFHLLWDTLVRQLNPASKDLGAHIREAMDYSPVFYIPFFGRPIAVTEAVLTMWLTMVLLALFALFAGRRLRMAPSRRQTLVELLLDSVLKLGRNSGLKDEQTKRILPFVSTVGLFIMLSNCLSVFKLKPPSQNPSFPIVLSLLTLGYILVMTVRFIGFRGFGQALLYPKAALLPFKILDLAIKPVSLAFRLFGNIFGAFILMEFVSLIVPAFLPGVLGLWFDLGDGLIQGGIFAYLTIVYIGEFVENCEARLEAKEEKERMLRLQQRKSSQQG